VLNELKTTITVFIRNISQADLQKVFANKLKRVQTCTEARGYHYQQLCTSAQRLSGRTVQVMFVMKTNLMQYLSLIYFLKQPLHVSGLLIAHRQDVFTLQ
jgi:hypothetical protein